MSRLEAHRFDLLKLIPLTDYFMCVTYQFILLILMICVLSLHITLPLEELLSHLVQTITLAAQLMIMVKTWTALPFARNETSLQVPENRIRSQVP